MDNLELWALRVATALRDGTADHLLADLAALPVTGESTALLAVLRADQARTPAPDPELVLEPGSPAARLLRAVGAFPGRTAQELREVTLLDEPTYGAAARQLIEARLVTSTRFEKPDCWTRTTRGAQAARLLP